MLPIKFLKSLSTPIQAEKLKVSQFYESEYEEVRHWEWASKPVWMDMFIDPMNLN